MKKISKYIRAIVEENKKNIIVISILFLISSIISILVPVLTQRLIDIGLMEGNVRIVVVYSLAIFAIYLANSFINLTNETIRIKIEKQFKNKLGCKTIKHILNLKIHNFDNQNYSEVFYKSYQDINCIAGLVDKGMMIFLTQIVSFLGGLIGIFIVGKGLGFIVIAFIPIKWIFVQRFAKAKDTTVKNCIDYDGEYAKWFGNMLGGIKEVKLFAFKQRNIKEHNYHYDRILKESAKLQKLDEWDTNINVIITQLLVIIIYIAGAYFVSKNILSVGAVLAFMSYSTYVINPIFIVLNIRYSLSAIYPSIDRFEDFMQWEEETDLHGFKAIPDKADLEFREVSFGYSDSPLILKNISLKIHQGEKIAIVGKNGAGKTTLIEILLRLYDIITGCILLNGKNILEYSLDSYRKIFSVVSQNVYLFNDTLMNNITLGDDFGKREIRQVLMECGLEKFADDNKLDEVVGENGVLLSGGEKQKISLARAIIHDAPIIILDEPTSNMDVKSYSYLERLLDNKLKNKTIICISHNYELIKMFDKIVFLESGNAAEYNAAEIDSDRIYDFIKKAHMEG